MKRNRFLSIFLCFVIMTFAAVPVYADTDDQSVDVRLEIETKLSGDTPSTPETFTFKLEAKNGAPMPENDTLTLQGEARGYFSPITFTALEDYHYTLRQIAGNAEGYTYDATVYDVTVQVITDENGKYTASVYICEAGSELKSDKAVFVNVYKAPVVPTDPTSPTDPSGGKPPQTGQTSALPFWITLGGAALLGLLATLALSGKRKRER